MECLNIVVQEIHGSMTAFDPALLRQRCDKIEADMKQQFQEATQRVETIQKKILEKQRQKGRQ